MAWSGSGTFTRVHSWTDDRDSGIKILASRMDTEDDGFATGINACLAKNGENSATGNLNIGGNRLTNLSSSVSARTDAAPVSVVQDSSVMYAAVSGTDTYTASLSPAITAYTNGLVFRGKFTNANTGAATLNLNSVGAVSITKNNGTALVSGDIAANQTLELVYNSTGPKFDIIGPVGILPIANGGTGAATLAGASIVTGPASATDTALVRFDNTTGKVVQNSVATLTDAGNLTIAGTGQTSTLIQGTGGEIDLFLDRTDTHGDGVYVGSFNARGRDSEGNTQVYARFRAACVLDNSGAETGAVELWTGAAGITAQRVIVRLGLYTPNATSGDMGADTINASAIYDDGVQITPLVHVAEVALSGTAGTTFSSIPSWVRRITVMLRGVSLDDTDSILIQVGDSGGLHTTGYTATGGTNQSAWTDYTAGFGIRSIVAAQVITGIMTLIHVGGNVWVSDHHFTDAGGPEISGSGQVTLDTALTQLAILDTGADNFDAGTISIMYE